MNPRCEIQPKVYHVRFYDSHPDNYSSSFQLFVDGKIGTIYGLNGAGFFKWASLHLAQVLKETGVETLQATMMGDTLEALRKALEPVAVVTSEEKFDIHGRREMHQVLIKRIDAENAK